ncbi:hypothetical protein Bca52824_010320 [Brassica carinata]|uniref:Uncharacterized protein n=1 Tax=Brassica carinata TaxID=52824 RepID=A0A8X8BAL2_BRACI|nr:hypothetical protein Bca52824_010320 [Brassica carinata]
MRISDSESGDLKEYKEHADNFVEISILLLDEIVTPSSSFVIRVRGLSTYQVSESEKLRTMDPVNMLSTFMHHNK